jgi:hypothetical protein
MARRKANKGYKNRFGWTCMLCGCPASDVHHIIPLSHGGRDIPENRIILCHDCHKKSGLHSNFEDQKIGLLAAKFYAEACGTMEEQLKFKEDACTRHQGVLNELSVVPKGNPQPEEKPEILPTKMPLCLPRSAEDKQFCKRCDWIIEEIRNLRSCNCGCHKVFIEFAKVILAIFPQGGK